MSNRTITIEFASGANQFTMELTGSDRFTVADALNAASQSLGLDLTDYDVRGRDGRSLSRTAELSDGDSVEAVRHFGDKGANRAITIEFASGANQFTMELTGSDRYTVADALVAANQSLGLDLTDYDVRGRDGRSLSRTAELSDGDSVEAVRHFGDKG